MPAGDPQDQFFKKACSGCEMKDNGFGLSQEIIDSVKRTGEGEFCKDEKTDRPDNWAHRPKGMRCSSCMWFAPKPTMAVRVENGEITRVGRCRRHAPTMSGYPVVYENDWCGDHKIDENPK